MSQTVYSVTELNNLLKKKINLAFPSQLQVEGEISNYSISGGHAYFSMKDKGGVIRCIIWRSTLMRINDKIKDGEHLTVKGMLDIYCKGGSYSLIVSSIKSHDKSGDIYQQLEILKKKFADKGYFREDIKKPLPPVINRVGIITAPQSAALQDFLSILQKNNTHCQIYLRGCQVQGEKCHLDIVQALQELEKYPLDLIILARGGGSLEDLIQFSHEKVIKQIYKCPVCVISAVGHEVDYMLSDFVADIRAPTPSMAAQTIVSHHQELEFNLQEMQVKMESILELDIQKWYTRFHQLEAYLVSPKDKVIGLQKELGNMSLQLQEIMQYILQNKIQKWESYQEEIKLLNPKEFLHKALYQNKSLALITTSDTEGKKLINKRKYLEKYLSSSENKELRIKFHDGEINVKVSKIM